MGTIVFQADPGSVAAEGLRTIRGLYEVERGIVQDPQDDRRKARKMSKLTALDFFAWADGVLRQVSARTPFAEALRYAVRLKPALLAYTEDGRLEIDNNLAENALRASPWAGRTGCSPAPTAVASALPPCIACSKPPS